jgi:hypothetical protein
MLSTVCEARADDVQRHLEMCAMFFKLSSEKAPQNYLLAPMSEFLFAKAAKRRKTSYSEYEMLLLRVAVVAKLNRIRKKPEAERQKFGADVGIGCPALAYIYGFRGDDPPAEDDIDEQDQEEIAAQLPMPRW